MDARVLFVCSGNICRSPAAEGIFKAFLKRDHLQNHIGADSAGTLAYHAGEPADVRMRRAALERRYSLTSLARQVSLNDFDEFDLILAMDDGHYDHLRRMAPNLSAMNKVKRMVDYCRILSVDHVPDPYYGGSRGFENVLDILEDACEGLLASLVSERKREK